MDKIVKVETEDPKVFIHTRPEPGAWYCGDCHVLHVMRDTCPDTGRARGDDDG